MSIANRKQEGVPCSRCYVAAVTVRLRCWEYPLTTRKVKKRKKKKVTLKLILVGASLKEARKACCTGEAALQSSGVLPSMPSVVGPEYRGKGMEIRNYSNWPGEGSFSRSGDVFLFWRIVPLHDEREGSC